MKMQHAYNPDAPKKPVNLTANSDLLRIAKNEGVNLSQTFELALYEEVRAHLQKKWLEENKGAIDHYNARIEKNGIFGAHKRRF